MQFDILDKAKQLELETSNVAAIQEILEFDRQLENKCGIYQTEKAKKWLRLHSTVLRWIKRVIAITFIFITPCLQVPGWCYTSE